jgi:hypothetical protein
MALGGGEKGKENERASTISKFITFLQEEDTKICTESS